MSQPASGEPIKVNCPICKGQLTIDRESGHVLHASAPKGAQKSFEAALGDVKQAEARREQDFLDAFQQEKTRRDLLDKKFETAKEKAESDPKPRINPMDID